MTYAMPNMTQPFEIMTYANTTTNGLFGVLVILGVFMVSFVALKNYKTGSAFAASTFITVILAWTLRILEVVPDWLFYITIFASVAGLAAVIFEGRWE
mgnify:CR=1 FL=1